MRLIDADAFIKHWNSEWRHLHPDDCYLVALANFPTIDAVPVVRCKDCKNWGGVTFGNVCRRWSAPLAGMKNCTGGNDYCSYGERRTND